MPLFGPLEGELPMNRPSLSLRWVPWLVWIVSLSLTGVSWRHEQRTADKAVRAQFEFALRETVGQVEQRALAYEQILRGVQGLFDTTSLTNGQAFRNYMRTLQLDANFSGIQSVGVIERVRWRDKSAHIAAMRRRGFEDYAIHPDGRRDEYTPVVQYEPHGGKRAELGLDHWANPVERQAMEMARDSGAPILTSKIQFPREPGLEDGPGFVMYLPLFAHGKPRDTIAERRENLIGWVYSAFRMRGFIASLYERPDPGLSLAIYDGADPAGAALLYRSGAFKGARSHEDARLTATEYLVTAGHTWTLVLGMGDNFYNRFDRSVTRVIAVTGVCLSTLLALLVWFIVNGRSRALQLATAMTEELRQMARRDPLTGLPNRALFSERVQQALAHAKRHGQRLAMIFIDLDDFKPVNDGHGHAVGDRVLQEVARRVQGAIRDTDTVGRIGGDEFVVLAPELSNVDAAFALAEKIRQIVRQPCNIDGLVLTLSCSLGAAVYPDDGIDEIGLMKAADHAMYRAKAQGRDGVALASRSSSHLRPAPP